MELENTSANNQQVADAGDNSSENNQGVATPDKAVQSADDNARFAAARREAESRYNNERNYWDNMAKARGYKNADDFKKALENEAADKDRESLGELFGVDGGEVESALNKVIANNPLVRQAQSIINEREAEASKVAFNKEVEAIMKIDPSIKSFDDVMNADSFADVDRIYRAGGKSLSEAYILANFERLMSADEGKVRQQVINQMSGKDHLSGNKGGMSSGGTIPADTLKIYKQMMPGKTEAEYQKHYEKYRKD